jgi:hypothetical protein
VFKKKPVLVAASITAVLLIIALAMAWLSGVSRLEQIRTELIARGEHLSWQEIAPKTPVGVSNGAHDLTPALNSIESPPRFLFEQQFALSGAVIPFTALGIVPVEIAAPTATGGREWVSNMWNRVDPLVAAHRRNWRDVQWAVTNQVIDFEHNWNDGFNLRLPHLSNLRHLCTWSQMALVVDLRNGDLGSALSLQTNALALLSKFDEPTLISQLVRFVCFDILLKGTWETLQSDGFSDGQLAALQAAVDSVRFSDKMLRAFEMERSMVISHWEECMNDPSLIHHLGSSTAVGATKRITAQLWRVVAAHRDLAQFLIAYQSQLTAARGGFSEKSELSLSAAFAALKSPAPPAIHMFSRSVMSHIEPTIKKALKAETQRELAITAIALKRHFQKHGQFPADLKELVPEFMTGLPIDWMDGKPLRYQRIAPHDYRLWSIGTDHTDDGGDFKPLKPGLTRHWNTGPDLVWPPRATPAEIEAFTRDRIDAWRKATAP